MKKIFTLLITTAMLSTAFAQYGQKGQQAKSKADDVYAKNANQVFDKHDNDNFGSYIFSAKERDIQVFQISREYNRKIYQLKSNFLMPVFFKMREIKKLESQRDAEISYVYAKFNSRKNQFGDFGKNDKKHW